MTIQELAREYGAMLARAEFEKQALLQFEGHPDASIQELAAKRPFVNRFLGSGAGALGGGMIGHAISGGSGGLGIGAALGGLMGYGLGHSDDQRVHEAAKQEMQRRALMSHQLMQAGIK